MGRTDWLLQAAMAHRERDLIEAKGATLSTDACYAGHYQVASNKRRAPPPGSMKYLLLHGVTVRQKPQQLSLFAA